MELLTWFHIVFVAVTIGTQGIRNVHSQNYPQPVEITDLYNYDSDPFDGHTTCPMINMKSYLQTLADYVSWKIPTYALVVVGAKSAGKSKGIQKMIEKWKEVNHTVLDIDLKGQPLNVSSSTVLKDVAKQIHEFPIANDKKLNCLLNHVIKNCSISVPVSEIRKIFNRCFNYSAGILVVVNIAVTLLKIIELRNPNPNPKPKPKTKPKPNPDHKPSQCTYYCIRMGLIVAAVFAIVFNTRASFQNTVTEVVDPLHRMISAGDWTTLSCACDGIAICTPENRPILIVREFVSFDENSRNDLLRSLEQMKQEIQHFPVILETSDFMWLKESPVIKSSDSFKPYYLKEMTFEEGETELVDNYKMLTHEEFVTIYDALGGHGGSYAALWRMIKNNKMNITEAISSLKDLSYSHLMVCINYMQSDIQKVQDLFCTMKMNKFKIAFNWNLPDLIQNFTNCNLLFAGEDNTIYPQKRLMQHAITTFLNKYEVNCSNLQIRNYRVYN